MRLAPSLGPMPKYPFFDFKLDWFETKNAPLRSVSCDLVSV